MTVPFPFFVGCGRSGTTLLRAMFDSHPHMAIPGESHFIAPMALQRARYESTKGFDSESFTTDLLRHPRFRLWSLTDGDVRDDIIGDPPRDLAEAVRRVFAMYARSRGKARYGDKTPIYVIHLHLLARLFPDGRFVHIIRDGRDVALSYQDVDFGPRSLAESALHWKRWVESGREAGRRLGPTAYREVRYEDLLSDPNGVLGALSSFLGLEYDDAMLQYPDRAAEVVTGSAFPRAHERLGLPPTKGLRDWRRQMPREDLASFEAIAGDLLEELGYERSGVRPSGLMRLRLRSEVVRLTTGSIAHAIRKRVRIKARS